MASGLILVNGLPGSGKTTLADSLAAATGLPLLVKDRVKEALAGALGDLQVNLGALAMEIVWSAAAELDGTVIVDSWWWRPRDLGHAGTGVARSGASRVDEIWCVTGVELARSRYRTRQRDPVHRDADRFSDWELWAASAAPLALGAVIEVDTSATVDIAALRDRLALAGETRPGEG